MSDPAMKRLDELTTELWMEIVALNAEHEDYGDKLRATTVTVGKGLGTVRRMAGLEALAEARVVRTVKSA